MTTNSTTNGTATIEIAVDPATAWNYVTDLSNMGTLSTECERAEWTEGATAAAPGAKIHGFNKAGDFEWDTVSTVISAVPGADFSFAVAPDYMPATIWRYLIVETDGGCQVTETFDCPAALNFGPDRVDILQQNIETTLERLKTALES